eukprot:g29920.t1
MPILSVCQYYMTHEAAPAIAVSSSCRSAIHRTLSFPCYSHGAQATLFKLVRREEQTTPKKGLFKEKPKKDIKENTEELDDWELLDDEELLRRQAQSPKKADKKSAKEVLPAPKKDKKEKKDVQRRQSERRPRKRKAQTSSSSSSCSTATPEALRSESEKSERAQVFGPQKPPLEIGPDKGPDREREPLVKLAQPGPFLNTWTSDEKEKQRQAQDRARLLWLGEKVPKEEDAKGKGKGKRPEMAKGFVSPFSRSRGARR